MALTQMLAYSDVQSASSTIEVTDVLTGASLSSTKINANIVPKSLSIPSNSVHLIFGDNTLVHFKSAKNADSQTGGKSSKVILPGKVTAMAVTDDGNFAIVAISEKVHVWQISTGDLVATLNKHLQPVTVIKITDDSIITAGDDGSVLIWDLRQVIRDGRTSSKGDLRPKNSISHHQAKVTDVAIGSFGTKVASCSLDKSCRIYDVSNGEQLVSIFCPSDLHCVAMDPLGYWIFMGAEDGNIYQTKLHEREKEGSGNSSLLSSTSKESKASFIGHKERVHSVVVSIDGLVLFSASMDSKIKLWHVLSKQCLRTIACKGKVTNLLCCVMRSQFLPSSSSSSSSSSSTVATTWKRNFSSSNGSLTVEEWADGLTLELPEQKGKAAEEERQFLDRVLKRRGCGDFDDEVTKSKSKLEEEISKMKEVNASLFRYSVDELFKKCAT